MKMHELICYWCISTLMQQINVAKKINYVLLAMLSKKVVIYVG